MQNALSKYQACTLSLLQKSSTDAPLLQRLFHVGTQTSLIFYDNVVYGNTSNPDETIIFSDFVKNKLFATEK